ncbi:MAG: ADOP family duplicated permease [Gemmatimonadaceae bacterium]
MSALTDVIARVRALVLRSREERDLDEELRFHLDRDVAERMRRGIPADVARRQARLALGGVEQRKEDVRDARGVRPLQELSADVRYAVRGLRRNPAYTITGIAVLALGLGATTAVFSVMDSVVFARLPYPDPDRLVRVTERGANGPFALSTADAMAIREQQRSFEAWGAAQRSEVALAGVGVPERIAIGRVEAGFVAAIGVPPAVGRSIQASDEDPGSPDVMVLSHALAVRRFGGAASAIGQALTIDGVPHTVIGVLPVGRDELGGLRASAWPALKLGPPTRRGPFWLRGVGRLKPGVSLEAAARDLAAVSARLLPIWPDFRDSSATFEPLDLHESIVGRADRQVYLFGGGVLLVLLLAITNVTTLALVRASARESEVAVRTMLGARSGRIARLLITESLVLTMVAGVVGLALAIAGIRLAVAQLPDLPRIHDSALNWRSISVALTAAVSSGVLVSLSPLATLVGKRRGSFTADTKRTGAGRRTNAIRGMLVTTEFALALPLLVGAGLLLNSFVRLQRVDAGFDTTGLVAMGVNLPAARYADGAALDRFRRAVEQRLVDRYGAEVVGIASEVPPDNSGNTDNFNLVRHPVPAGQSEPASPWYYVTTGYFTTLGVRLLAGRPFTEGDTGEAAPVVIVSRSWAQRYLPGEDPVGQQLVQGGCYNCPRTTIVGVVADIKNLGPAGATDAVYGPIAQSYFRSLNLVVRARSATAGALREMRDDVQQIDPELPIEQVTIADRFSDALADPRRWAAVLAAFASAGMALSALGVFGLMSYAVRQRRREIGVRLALGARPSEIMRLVMVRGMRYALIGSGIGLAIAIVLSAKLQTLLFEVRATDLGTMVGVVLLLLASALLACWLPGHRAARIKPLEAIGSD